MAKIYQMAASKKSKGSVADSRNRVAAAGKADKKPTKGQTLRLNLEAWRQLRYLAIDKNVTAHDLLIEAVNDLFRKYGKPPRA